jgi:CBS domain-containing protein
MKTCDTVMTKNPICCLPTDTVLKVAQMMEHENIGSVPVVENELTRKLVGIVTDRDLALRIVAEGREAKSVTAEAVMTRKVITCRPDDDLQIALDAMAQNQLRRIPIVESDNRVLGIIAQADVATRSNEPEETAALVKGISRSNTE